MATPQPVEPAVADVPPLRRMTRSSTNRVVAGVCAGVAEHLGVSVRTVRIVTIGLSVAAAGIPMYLMLWALAPQDTETQASDRPARPMVRVDRSQAGLLAGVVLLVIGLSSLGTFSWLGSGQGWLLPVAAILAGAAVAWSQFDEDDRPDGAPETPWRKALRVVRPGLGLTVVVLAFATATSSFMPSVPWRGGVGDHTFTPTVTLAPAYTTGVGELDLDLTQLSPSVGDGARTSVRVGAGSVTIQVPKGVHLVVDAQVGLGSLTVESADGRKTFSRDGGGFSTTVDAGSGTRTVHLDLQLGLGEATIKEQS